MWWADCCKIWYPTVVKFVLNFCANIYIQCILKYTEKKKSIKWLKIERNQYVNVILLANDLMIIENSEDKLKLAVYYLRSKDVYKRQVQCVTRSYTPSQCTTLPQYIHSYWCKQKHVFITESDRVEDVAGRATQQSPTGSFCIVWQQQVLGSESALMYKLSSQLNKPQILSFNSYIWKFQLWQM